MKRTLMMAALLITGLPHVILAQPGMSTLVQGVSLTYEGCRSRVRQVLAAQGYGAQRDLGNGLLGFTSTHAVSAVCVRGAGETVVVVTAACMCDATPARDRLFEAIREGAGPRQQRPALAAHTEWNTTATQYRGQTGRRYAFDCPPEGVLSTRIWGSNPYTDDSSVCTAGVHAGVITRARGGRVVIEIEGPYDQYPASLRNGVQAGAWERWLGSFRVVSE